MKKDMPKTTRKYTPLALEFLNFDGRLIDMNQTNVKIVYNRPIRPKEPTYAIFLHTSFANAYLLKRPMKKRGTVRKM
jgi:hypothetical protein